ncbi:MAG TPA: tetratricopeptide repeat protein [Rhizomicrobium sp.]|nr:tetratricopeptide repeat protein [Rhizomicrobium sp.]
MDRFLVRTAAVVFCAAWAVGCSHVPNDTPVTVPSADGQSGEAPTTMAGVIASAEALRVKGDYDGAASAFGQIMIVAPDNPQVVAEYGKSLLQQGHPEDALPFLRRALELRADDWTVYSALGVAYDQTNDHANAKLAYEHALALKPGALEVLNNFAMSRMLAGDLEGARRLMAKVGGSGNPKIAANIELLAGMHNTAVRTPVAHATAAADVPHALPQKSAAASAPRALAKVVVQNVPADAKTGPLGHRQAGKKSIYARASHAKPGATKGVWAAQSHKTTAKPVTVAVAQIRIAPSEPGPEPLAAFARVPMLRTSDDGEE